MTLAGGFALWPDDECYGDISTVRRRCGRKLSPMFINPEAQTPILRTALVAAAAVVCVVGAIRTERRWVRVTLVIVAVLATLFAMFGVFVTSLILRYGPR